MCAVGPGTGHLHAHKKPHGELSMACGAWLAPGTVTAGGSGSLQSHRRILTGGRASLETLLSPHGERLGMLPLSGPPDTLLSGHPHQKFTTVQVKLQMAKRGQIPGEHCEVAVKLRVLEMK